VTDRGHAKVLDFGLAKLTSGDGATSLSVAPTAAMEEMLTSPGTAVGTVAYMSPEQARGEELDARTDLFSFGAVLYEMATGRMTFPGKTPAVIHEAILNRSPVPASQLNPTLPAKLDEIIAKTLEKDRKLRYQNAADILADLQRLKRDTESSRIAVTTTEARSKPMKSISFRWATVAGAAVLAAGLAIGAWLFHTRKAHALTDKDTIVLADFTNTTGDTVFDGTLRQGLAVQLAQSPFLSLVSDTQVQRTLKLMGEPANARLTPEVARQLCQRTDSAAVLDGSIASLGNQYVLGIKAVGCRTGDSLVEEQVTADRKEDVLKVLSQAAVKLREKLGESLSTVEKFDTPLEQATTSSLEALQSYSLGRKMRVENNDNVGSVPLFNRATELDPNFAMAYAGLAANYANLGEATLAATNSRKAYELRERVSERERFSIEALYNSIVAGDLEKARETYELWEETYPKDVIPHYNLGAGYMGLGQYEKALVESRESLRLEPGSAIAYGNVALCYSTLNRMQDAWSTAQEAQTKNLDSAFLRTILYRVAFSQSDAARMAELVSWSAGKPGVEDVFLNLEASRAAYYGKPRDAQEFSRRAVASALQAGKKETAGGYEGEAASREAFFGNAAAARGRAAAALALSTGRDVQNKAAFGLAMAGDTVRAQALADDLAERFRKTLWCSSITCQRFVQYFY